jgi:hypothetical protein
LQDEIRNPKRKPYYTGGVGNKLQAELYVSVILPRTFNVKKDIFT